jgi:hypothetical protein
VIDTASIDLYGSFTNYLTNMPVNGTFTNTVSTATWLKTVQMDKTADGYVYNTVLAPNQVFVISANGVEATIKQEG